MKVDAEILYLLQLDHVQLDCNKDWFTVETVSVSSSLIILFRCILSLTNLYLYWYGHGHDQANSIWFWEYISWTRTLKVYPIFEMHAKSWSRRFHAIASIFLNLSVTLYLAFYQVSEHHYYSLSLLTRCDYFFVQGYTMNLNCSLTHSSPTMHVGLL